MTGTWNGQTQCLGAFIRNRRKLARLSLRQLAEMTSLSNAYLSQLERGLHLLTGPQHRRRSLPSAPTSAWPTSRRPR